MSGDGESDRDRYVTALLRCRDCSRGFKVPTAVRDDVVACPFCRGERVVHEGPFDG